MTTMTISGKDITTYGFYLKHKVIKPGATVTKYVDIPGKSGVLDLSTYLTGSPVYENDELEIELISVLDSSEWQTKVKLLTTNYHGKFCTVVFSDTPYTYAGRIEIESAEQKDNCSFEVKMSMIVQSKTEVSD